MTTNSSKTIKAINLYLMGQLTGPSGEAIAGNGLHPLPGYMLSLPNNQSEAQKDLSSSQNQAPIYISDSSGRLQGVNSQLENLDSLAKPDAQLTSSPLVLNIAAGKKVEVQTVFIPEHLLPLAVMSGKTSWARDIHSIAEKITTKLPEDNNQILIVQKILSEDIRADLEDKSFFMSPENAEIFTQAAQNAEVLLGGNKDAYQELYKRLYSGQFDHDFHYLRVPQVWTINLVFSADYFAGAKVTISGYPEALKIQGDGDKGASLPTSYVRKVDYYDYSDSSSEQKDKLQQYIATFWIVGGELENEKQLEQLCRFDIDLNSAKELYLKTGNDLSYVTKSIDNLQIPNNSYSLSEQVLHLPIQSIAGRSVLVSGDPITVEEALFQHAPQRFKHLVDWAKNQPYTKDNQPQSGNVPSVNLLNTLGTYKSVIEVSTSGVLNGPSMTTMLKAFSAGLSAGINDDGRPIEQNALKTMQAAINLNGSAGGFIDFTNKLPELSQDNVKTFNKLADIFKWSDELGTIVDKSVTYIPKELRQFWHNVDSKVLSPLKPMAKAIEYSLDKPFGYAQLISTGLGVGEKFEASNNSFNSYLEKSQDYAVKTQSGLKQFLTLASDKEKKDLAEQEKNYKQELIDKFQKQPEGKVIIQGSSSEPGKPIILRLFFNFDSASNALAPEDLELISTISGYLENTQAEMELRIRGYTCDLGSTKYNLDLSSRRAKTLKQAIVKELSVEQQIRWQHRIITVGMGEQDPISKDKRSLNRRAEVEFFLHSALEYPVCRSWILGLEKRRQASVISALDKDNALQEFAGQSFDLALGIAATALGPELALCYAVYWLGNTVYSVYQAAQLWLEGQSAELNKQLDKFSEFDVIAQSLILKESDAFEELSVLGRAYLKRSLALNGLMRLLLQENYMEKAPSVDTHNGSDHTITSFGSSSNKIDLDIEGYINTFLLSDDWEVGNRWFTSFHLDEVWLENKGLSEHSGSESLKSYYAMANYIFYSIKQSDENESVVDQAQKYQKYCPVHTLSDKSLKSLRDMVKAPDIRSLDSNIYKDFYISVRKNGSKTWQSLDKVLADDGYITPTDEVRVLTLLDMSHQNLQKIEPDLLKLVPISVRPVRINRFFDDFGSYTTEYVRQLDTESLTDNEQSWLKENKYLTDESTTLYGAVVTPTYYFGRSIITGIKPIDDDFDSDEWLVLYGQPKDNESYEYRMRYKLEVAVAGASSTEKTVTYTRTYNFTADPKQAFNVDNSSIFELSMRSEHEYLYEKSFLACKGKKAVTYPAIFSEPKVNIYVKDANAQALIPGDEYSDALNALGWTKDTPMYDVWNNETRLLVIVSSKAHSDVAKVLNSGKFDPTSIPVDMYLTANARGKQYRIKLNKANSLTPLGKITFDKDTHTPSFSEKPISKGQVELIDFSNKLKSNLKTLWSDFAVKEHSFFSGDIFNGEPVDTDLYAVEVSLDYLNVTGKKVLGVRPFLHAQNQRPQIRVEVTGKDGSQLIEEKSNRITLSPIDVTEASFLDARTINYADEWYAMDKGKFENVKSYHSIRNDNYDDNVVRDTKYKAHNETKLSIWMNSAPKFTDYQQAINTPLSDERKDLLAKWLLNDF